jgi:shikimate 5-dehydrogenase
MIEELSKKQRTELRAAVLFVKTLGLEINHNDFTFPEESDSVDVVYEPKKLKFLNNLKTKKRILGGKKNLHLMRKRHIFV